MAVPGIKSIASLDDLGLLSARDAKGVLRLYRGLRKDYSRNLVPGMFRDLRKGNLHPRELEDKLLEQFAERAAGMISPAPRNEYEWSAVAQHHKMLTRLLDWTSSASVALWFALEKEPASAPCLWTFIPDDNDIGIPLESGFLARPACGKTTANAEGQVSEAKSMSSGRGHAGRTLVFEHLTVCSRMRQQRGWFMCFPDRNRDKKLPKAFEKNGRYRDRVERWSVDTRKRDSLLADLEGKGVSRASLFPPHDDTCSGELDSMCCELKREWLRRSGMIREGGKQ